MRNANGMFAYVTIGGLNEIKVFRTDNFSRLKAIRTGLTIAAHNGRLVKTTGDGLLVEFSSVVDALCSATELQTGMAAWNATVATDKRVWRLGGEFLRLDWFLNNLAISGLGYDIYLRYRNAKAPII